MDEFKSEKAHASIKNMLINSKNEYIVALMNNKTIDSSNFPWVRIPGL